MKSADAPTPAHDTHTPAGEVVLLTIPPESDPAVMRDPGAWRPTFDLERGYWVERAELLNEVDRLAARVAELEADRVCPWSLPMHAICPEHGKPIGQCEVDKLFPSLAAKNARVCRSDDPPAPI